MNGEDTEQMYSKQLIV